MRRRTLTIGDAETARLWTARRLRTVLSVALRKDDSLLGLSSLLSAEVRPFSDKQIALLENFAAQAVIAMENARLLNEIRQRQEELRITFENMGDGVAMFDETQHLVAWNSKFQEIFDLPDVLLEQHRTYEEHLRFLAARGDFGAGVDTAEQIDELVASTGQPYGYERTRPDGRVIEIRRNPVPDGGFVLIFSDITERKRSEAEIRAARDAAEASVSRPESRAGQPDPGREDGVAGSTHSGHRARDQEPAELRQQLRRPVGGSVERTEGNRRAGLRCADRKAARGGRRGLGHADQQPGEDHRARQTCRRHREGDAGTLARVSGERRMVDLNALIDEALNLAYHGARAQDQSFNIALERDFGEGIAPIEVNPQDITRVFLNLFGNGFYAATKRARDGGDAGFRADAEGQPPAMPARRWKSACGTTAPAFRPTSGTNCSSRSSPPSQPAKAPASACRSPTTSSRSSMAAASLWTARSANTASSRYGCRATRKRLQRTAGALPISIVAAVLVVIASEAKQSPSMGIAASLRSSQ